jgi:hypothetical protein
MGIRIYIKYYKSIHFLFNMQMTDDSYPMIIDHDDEKGFQT